MLRSVLRGRNKNITGLVLTDVKVRRDILAWEKLSKEGKNFRDDSSLYCDLHLEKRNKKS